MKSTANPASLSSTQSTAGSFDATLRLPSGSRRWRLSSAQALRALVLCLSLGLATLLGFATASAQQSE